MEELEEKDELHFTGQLDEESISTKKKIISILLVGILSVYTAEVFAGSSPFWFIDPIFSPILLIPLYMLHTIILFNLAWKTRRIKMYQLYLLGVIFGLYESWITKVLWAGYFDQNGNPAWGKFMGFAIAETLVLITFWHPIYSFILPLINFQMLTMPKDFDDKKRYFEGVAQPLEKWLIKNKKNKVIYGFLYIIGGLFLAHNIQFNLTMFYFAMSVNLLIIGIIYWILTRIKGFTSIRGIILGKIGTTLGLIYLALIYLITFTSWRPQYIPGVDTIFLTMMIYIIVFTLFFISRSTSSWDTSGDNARILENSHESSLEDINFSNTPKHFNAIDFLKFNFLTLISGTLSCLFPPIGTMVLIFAYLSYIVIGSCLFITNAFIALKGKFSNETKMN